MKSLLALLSHHEEATLRKIDFGVDDPLEHAHVRRLLQLELIEWAGDCWRLTPVGRRRHERLMNEVVLPFAA